MLVFQDRTLERKSVCVWEDKGGDVSVLHMLKLELYVDYPEKSRLELEVQAEFVGVTSKLLDVAGSLWYQGALC